MTSRERLQTVLAGGIPDHVPVAPDTSNMIPCKLTGRPFWDIYLYEEIPLWKAYIDCVKHFGFDSLMDGYVRIRFEELEPQTDEYKEAIVARNDERIVTRVYREANGKRFWQDTATVYGRATPAITNVPLKNVGADFTPSSFERVQKRNPYGKLQGAALLKTVKDELGERGLVGVFCGGTVAVGNEAAVYEYHDNPEKYEEMSRKRMEHALRYLDMLLSQEVLPDFVACGGSGTLVFQTVETFRKLALPMLQRITAVCKRRGIPTHVHSCGPEKEIVRICAEETDLTVIDPLEVPPMGDCNLAELKRLYGERIVLKGNLHTTDVMLRGSPQQVADACKRAIDDAAQGGRFILSTGDQCGRDTPEANIFTMIETAKTYGRY